MHSQLSLIAYHFSIHTYLSYHHFKPPLNEKNNDEILLFASFLAPSSRASAYFSCSWAYFISYSLVPKPGYYSLFSILYLYLYLYLISLSSNSFNEVAMICSSSGIYFLLFNLFLLGST